MPVNYVHADGKDYVVVADTSLKGLADIKPPHGITPVPEKSYFFARYTLRRDRLDIYQVDDERMAQARHRRQAQRHRRQDAQRTARLRARLAQPRC